MVLIIRLFGHELIEIKFNEKNDAATTSPPVGFTAEIGESV